MGLNVKLVSDSFLTKSFGMLRVIYLGGLISNIYITSNRWFIILTNIIKVHIYFGINEQKNILNLAVEKSIFFRYVSSWPKI